MVSLNASGDSATAPQSPFVLPRPQVPGRQAIALIADHVDPAADMGKEGVGGQTVYVRQVGEALARLGWQVDMFTRKVNANDSTIVHHTPHCRTIRLEAGPPVPMPSERLMDYLPSFVESFQKFQTKEGSNYPLIHTNYWTSAWVGLQLRQHSNIQLVHTYHSLGAVKYQALVPRPAITETRLAVERQILEQATCIVATTPQEEEDLRTWVSQQGLVEVIPCGTDLATFHAYPQEEARHVLGWDPTEAIALYVGRFDPVKGLETLIRACAHLRASQPNLSSLRLVVVGGSDSTYEDMQERQRIEQIVQDLGLAQHVTFVGQVGHDRLPLYYTAADLCVIPSHYEPFGLVAIEAMACGTPVVAAAVGGLKFTVVPEETGLLVPPQDVPALAQAMDRILSDQRWAHKLRQQAPVRVQQNFSWSGVAARLSDLYRRLIAQSISHDLLGSMAVEAQSSVGSGRSSEFPLRIAS